MSDAALLAAMVDVEHAWLEALVDTGIAPAEARADDPTGWSSDGRPEGSRRGRGRRQPGDRPGRAAARAAERRTRRAGLHRGLTSQDVVDTALMLCLATPSTGCDGELARPGRGPRADCRAAPGHTDGRPHPDPARRADHVRPQGGRLADRRPRRRRRRWRRAVAASGAGRRRRRHPGRGRRAGALRGLPEPAQVSWRLVEPVASALGLGPAVAVAHLAGDGHPARRRAGRLHRRLGADRQRRAHAVAARRSASSPRATGGGSSTMPHKAQPGALRAGPPRRAGRTPSLPPTLHLAAAEHVDERAGRRLARRVGHAAHAARRTVVAGSQTTELSPGSGRRRPDGRKPGRGAGIDAEQQAMADLVAAERREEYLGTARAERGSIWRATERIVDRRLGSGTARALERTDERSRASPPSS